MEIGINIVNKKRFKRVKDIDFDLHPVYINSLYRRYPFFRGEIDILLEGKIRKFVGEFKPDTYEKEYGFRIEVF